MDRYRIIGDRLITLATTDHKMLTIVQIIPMKKLLIIGAISLFLLPIHWANGANQLLAQNTAPEAMPTATKEAGGEAATQAQQRKPQRNEAGQTSNNTTIQNAGETPLNMPDTGLKLWKILAIFAAIILGLNTFFKYWRRRAKEKDEWAVHDNVAQTLEKMASKTGYQNQDKQHSSDAADSDEQGNTAPVAAETEQDPITAAAIYLAYGRREQAIKTLEQALSNNPKQSDITLKLLTLYHNDSDITAFTELFESAAETIENDHQWKEIKQLALEAIPDHAIHVYDSNEPIPVLQEPDQHAFSDSQNIGSADIESKGDGEESDIPDLLQTHENYGVIHQDLFSQDIDDTSPESSVLSAQDLKTTFALAKAYIDIGNEAAAAEYISDVIRNDQGKLGTQAQLMLDSLNQDMHNRTINNQVSTRNKPDSSLRHFSKTPKNKPLDIQATEELGLDGALAQDEPSGAPSLLDDQPATTNQDTPESALTLAKAYMDLGEFALARDFLEDASATTNDQEKAEIQALLAELREQEDKNPVEITPHNEDTLDDTADSEQFILDGKFPVDAEKPDEPASTNPDDQALDDVIDELFEDQGVEPTTEEDNSADSRAHQTPAAPLEPEAQDTSPLAAQMESNPDNLAHDPEAAVALSKAYIALNEFELARRFLDQATLSGNIAQQNEAQKILAMLDEGGDFNTLSSLPVTPVNDNETETPAGKDRPNLNTQSDQAENTDLDVEKADNIVEDAQTSTQNDNVTSGNTSVESNTEMMTLAGESDLTDQNADTEPEIESFAVDIEQEASKLENRIDLSESDEAPLEQPHEFGQDDRVEFGQHDPETALELAKAYIELGDIETAKQVLENVAHADNDKCKLEAQDLLATLDSEMPEILYEAQTIQKDETNSQQEETDELLDLMEMSESELDELHALDDEQFDELPWEPQTDIPTMDDDIVADIEQHDPETAIELAEAYVELGELEIARDILRNIVDKNLGSEKIHKKAIANLKKLK